MDYERELNSGVDYEHRVKSVFSSLRIVRLEENGP